ncbi:MAG: preprotein translocase subunit SecY [Deltaproteobacteria bacterium]|nr:preprotein translocase subunit SecY [Deltaproteobacteria bacterium]
MGIEGLAKIPELRRRILYTLFILAVYRIGVHVPTPGIDAQALSQFFTEAKGTILSFFNLFSGNALRRLSIFSLGIMPYISASIIFQLLTVVVPHLERLSKEGEAGRRKITQYTRYATIVISLIQSFGISAGLETMRSPAGAPIVLDPGIGFKLMTMITLTSGTAFIMWLGEQITEKGIGNGTSLIIFAGIAAGLPSGLYNTVSLIKTGELSLFGFILILALMVAVIAFIVAMERGQRRIPVQYAKRVVGRKMYGGQATHLPLKINSSGVIPPIFASSLIMFPATLATFTKTPLMQEINAFLQPGGILYNVFFVALIVFFAFFYTAIVFNPVDVAENLKKFGGYIPGIRPGKNTADYIDQVLMRITSGGTLYLAAVCVLPTILIAKAKVPFYFGGTSLLILVGVAMDTAAQIESHLLSRHYEGFIHKAKMRGRRV